MSFTFKSMLQKLFPIAFALMSPLLAGGCCPRAQVVPPSSVDPAPEVSVPVVEPDEPTPTPDPEPVAEPEVVLPEGTELPEEVGGEAVNRELPETGVRHTLTPFTTALTVAPGDLLTHTFELHASVGKDASAYSENSRVVELIRRDVIYKHPEKMAAGMTGGDAASGTFVFKALRRGTAQLNVSHSFRGKVEHTIKVTVTVE